MLAIWIIIIIVALIWGFSYNIPKEEKDKEEQVSEIGSRIWGEDATIPHYIRYAGGIKGLSVNAELNKYVCFLKNAISVGITDKKKILYKDITDVVIENTKSIEHKVSMGKLLCFGILAFGMKKNKEEEIKEFIVVNVEDEDGQYSVIFDVPYQSQVQDVYNYIHKKVKESRENVSI